MHKHMPHKHHSQYPQFVCLLKAYSPINRTGSPQRFSQIQFLHMSHKQVFEHKNKQKPSFFKIYLEGTLREGEQTKRTWRKKPDSLPANRYHILEEKIQRPGRKLYLHPPTSVISSPGQLID